MADIYWDELREELHTGAREQDHPFRFFTFGTVGMDATARLRTVILRKVSEDLEITFFSDDRSKKIRHLKENNKAALLFYHPGKGLQLRIEGKAAIERDPETRTSYLEGLNPESLKDYTAQPAPGTIISGATDFEHLAGTSHFCAVAVTPVKIEYLKLNKPKHVRIQFSRLQNKWLSEFLVP